MDSACALSLSASLPLPDVQNLPSGAQALHSSRQEPRNENTHPGRMRREPAANVWLQNAVTLPLGWCRTLVGSSTSPATGTKCAL